jgi:hypothetical protein
MITIYIFLFPLSSIEKIVKPLSLASGVFEGSMRGAKAALP